VSGTAAIGGATVFIGLDDKVLLTTTTAAPFTHAFSTPVTIPAGTAPGSHTISAFQDGAGACTDQVATVTVLAGAVTPTEPLARTGSNSTMPLIRLGVGLLAAGGMAIFVSRRRKSSVTASA
jgi:LPXTG-motif cell wall-anchored protein